MEVETDPRATSVPAVHVHGGRVQHVYRRELISIISENNQQSLTSLCTCHVRPLQIATGAIFRFDADIAPVRVGMGGVETLQDPIGVFYQLGNLHIQFVQLLLDGLHFLLIIILDFVGLAEGETAKEEDDCEEELHLSTQPPALEVRWKLSPKLETLTLSPVRQPPALPCYTVARCEIQNYLGLTLPTFNKENKMFLPLSF